MKFRGKQLSLLTQGPSSLDVTNDVTDDVTDAVYLGMEEPS